MLKSNSQPNDYVPGPIPPATPLYRLLQRIAEAIAEKPKTDVAAKSIAEQIKVQSPITCVRSANRVASSIKSLSC
jgi:hypothetical protein